MREHRARTPTRLENKTMKNSITIRLTRLEADALRHAAGNVFAAMSEPEVRRDIFGDDGKAAAAGWRAWEKLRRELSK